MSSTTTEEVPFSQLLQHSRDTLVMLEQNRGRLRLVRRDAEDLILESARRAEADEEALSGVTSILVSLADTDRVVLDRIFPLAFPWMRFLPLDEAPAFVTEFIDTARACAGLGTLLPLSTTVTAWRATAAVYADENLLSTLTTPHEEADYGEVPEPSAQ
jgi:hypothetical protein